MAGDYSRFGFDPKKHFSQVLLEQGRVFTDRDFNEFGSILERRFRAQAVDVMGRCVVPSETPGGFEIAIAGSGPSKTLSIGRGRLYVDGLLAENHGAAPYAFDLSTPGSDGRPVGVLAEEIGLEAPTPYGEQPYWPTTDPLPPDEVLALVYLKVWQREVTALMDADLLEPALGGVDTTTRKQTVWQVRLLELEDDVVCSTPDAEISAWQQLVAPSPAHLSTRITEEPSDDNPCLIPETSGYTGAENQLYRVEIHDGGPAGVATCKWSRDNASVAARIESIAGHKVTVDRIGWDSVLGFQDQGWIEITDDVRQLGNASGRLPGVMARIQSIEGNVIELADDLPADVFPSGFDPAHNPRAIKWDSGDAIQVPAHETGILLEAGIEIEFASQPEGGDYHPGNFWTFAARTATGDIERLDRAPPHGPHYHYCRLALVRWPANDDEQPRVDDCRVPWPSFGGETCGCSVCVTPETHNSGALTIQQAIDQIAESGGTVCLDSGEYDLGDEPVRFQERNSIRMSGQGMATTLSFMGTGPAVVVDRSQDIVLDRFSLYIPGLPGSDDTSPEDLGGVGLLIRNSLRVTIEHCAVNQIPSEPLFATGILLDGVVFESVFRDNVFFTTAGILAAGEPEGDRSTPYLLSADLEISGNLFLTRLTGVGLDGLCFLAGNSRIYGNTIIGCASGSIRSTGVVFPGSRLDIGENQISAEGSAIIVATDNTRIRNNDVTEFRWSASLSERQPDDTRVPNNDFTGIRDHGQANGIVVIEGIDGSGIDDLCIIGNRLVGLSGRAIVLGHIVNRAMIKQNVIGSTGQGGLFMASDATAGTLTIENNQFTEVAEAFNDASNSIAALRIVNTDHANIANNSITGVARQALQPMSHAAIEVTGCDRVVVFGNDIVDVGPMNPRGATAALHVRAPFSDLSVNGNTVRRSSEEPQATGQGNWYAVRIEGSASGRAGPSAGDFDASLRSVDDVAPFSEATEITYVLVDRFAFPFTDRGIGEPRELTDSHVTIQSNHLHASGGVVPVVQIDSGDSCIFAGNQVSGKQLIAGGVATIQIAASQLVTANNIAQGPHGATSFALTADAFTVVGNITSGPIQVNQEPLSDTGGTGLNIVLPNS